METTTSQFAGFSDDELRVLWDALTMDDGIRYHVVMLDVSSDGAMEIESALTRNVLAEADRRGIELPDRWAGEIT